MRVISAGAQPTHHQLNGVATADHGPASESAPSFALGSPCRVIAVVLIAMFVVGVVLMTVNRNNEHRNQSDSAGSGPRALPVRRRGSDRREPQCSATRRSARQERTPCRPPRPAGMTDPSPCDRSGPLIQGARCNVVPQAVAAVRARHASTRAIASALTSADDQRSVQVVLWRALPEPLDTEQGCRVTQ